jgi:hypothetical protein
MPTNLILGDKSKVLTLIVLRRTNYISGIIHPTQRGTNRHAIEKHRLTAVGSVLPARLLVENITPGYVLNMITSNGKCITDFLLPALNIKA